MVLFVSAVPHCKCGLLSSPQQHLKAQTCFADIQRGHTGGTDLFHGRGPGGVHHCSESTNDSCSEMTCLLLGLSN